MHFLIIFLIALVAFSISAVSGGGAGLILIPLLSLSLDPLVVPAALTIGTTTSSVTRIITFYKHIEWSIVRWVVFASIPGVIAGGLLLKQLDPAYVELLLSLFLVSNLFLLFKKAETETTSRLPQWLLSVIGFLVGLISALTGAVGVLFNRVYFRYGLDNQAIIATRAANEVVVHILKLFMYAKLGLLTVSAVLTGFIVAAAALLSVVLVKAHIHRLPRHTFVRIGYAAMVASGIVMMNTAVKDINAHHHPKLEQFAKHDGGEMVLSWNDKKYTLEFSWDEGIEFEKSVPLASLPDNYRNLATIQCSINERIYIEAVYTNRLKEYEVHCFDSKENLSHKVKIVRT